MKIRFGILASAPGSWLCTGNEILTITFLVILTLLVVVPETVAQQKPGTGKDGLFNGFVSPPAQARPFVRWWWNGNQVMAREINRELDVLHKAGIGGIEINPIAMPEDAKNIGTKPVKWLSKEWNLLVAETAKEAAKRGMIIDMIVGSGWPFGGEFLKEKEMIQRVVTHTINYSEREEINLTLNQLIAKVLEKTNRESEGKAVSNELLFIKLVPLRLTSVQDIIDLTDRVSKTSQLVYTVPNDAYTLVYGIRQRGHRTVMLGAWGSKGPVMDHFNKEVTQAYLERLTAISRDAGVPLSHLIRALFCDSIELAGANWTDGFDELFAKTYGYRLESYYPFVFSNGKEGYDKISVDGNMADDIKRVRYDYNRLLVSSFLNNFTQTFQKFCTDNGVLCRYQAYGTPFLMGMMEGNMIPDIPEGNNWINPPALEKDEWIWNQGHGFMIWNLYAASGGHLTNRKVISVEAMTNTKAVFKTSLDEIKRQDDMNFISGINHTILHGFNYSPPEAGFPGWVRYGAYFSEQNPWWPYFPKWADYNARLSYMFQASQSVKDVAILGPTGDLWSNTGLTRVPFHTTPWYCYRLWESLSQNGSSADYISEAIIQKGTKTGGKLTYGPMAYQAILLCSVESMEPETVLALREFVKNGGKLIVVDGLPHRSLSMQNAAINDSLVQTGFSKIAQEYSGSMVTVKSPPSEAELLSWTTDLLRKITISKDVEIDNPDKNVFQIRQVLGNKDIYFFCNSNRAKSALLKTRFPTGKKTPWIWNPENGSREIFPFDESENELTIELRPLESLLLVFDPDMKGKPAKKENDTGSTKTIALKSPWKARFDHVNGSHFERSFPKWVDFGTSEDPQLNTFAGTVTYTTSFTINGVGRWLELDSVNRGITEVSINGKKLGVNWYGKPRFSLKDVPLTGENRLAINYITVLSNYARSLKNNPTADKWTQGYSNIPMGLEGEVSITIK